jgi:hypothetical protein
VVTDFETTDAVVGRAVKAGGWCETVRTIADRQRPNI